MLGQGEIGHADTTGKNVGPLKQIQDKVTKINPEPKLLFCIVLCIRMCCVGQC